MFYSRFLVIVIKVFSIIFVYNFDKCEIVNRSMLDNIPSCNYKTLEIIRFEPIEENPFTMRFPAGGVWADLSHLLAVEK